MPAKDAEATRQQDMKYSLERIGAAPLSPEQLSALAQPYRELIGEVPPRVAARHYFTGAIDERIVSLQEQIRNHVMSPACFDDKTTQLLVFAMLMMDLSDAAKTHAVAARRCGATWIELQAVVSLCFLFRGIPAANRGAALLAELAASEPAA
jgi:alkylhydroperoxidase/carboxymuconolactone decarboxylase family protein YurZ